MKELAIVISLYKEHVHYFKILFASIKYFDPDIPVIILKDGDFVMSELESQEGVIIIDTALMNSYHHLNLKGLLNKLNIFYLPEVGYHFHYYFHIDADSVLLNSIKKFLPNENVDFVAYQGSFIDYNISSSALIFNKYAFNPKHIEEQLFLDRLAYFSSGHFLIHHSFLNKTIIERYRNLMSENFNNQNVFQFGDQGFLNFYVNYHIKNKHSNILIKNVGIYGKEAPVNYPVISLKNIITKDIDSFLFIHYTGPSRKLYLKDHNFGDILKFFHNKYYREYSSDWRFLSEEASRLLKYYKKRIKKSIEYRLKVKNLQ